jgi:hypothetical protein
MRRGSCVGASVIAGVSYFVGGTVASADTESVVIEDVIVSASKRDVSLQALKLSESTGRRMQEIWKTLHDDEASWSTRSRHELIQDASHYVQFDRPDVVIEAVTGVVKMVREDR